MIGGGRAARARSGRSEASGAGAWVTCAARIACGVGPVNGGSPGEHLVGHDADRVEIGARVDRRLPGGLLRRHVRRRADREAERREGAAGRVTPAAAALAALATPKSITSACRPVSMMFSGLMSRWTMPWRVRVGQRVEHVPENPHACPPASSCPSRASRSPQGLALDERHHVVEERAASRPVGGDLARIDEGQNVGMLQVRGDADLAQEPLGAERGGELGLQDLERDRAIVLEVVREEDGRHAAAPELALERIANH